MSSEKCWTRGKAPKIQRSSCTPRWYCKRRFRVLRSIHWTRIFSISNDSSKDQWISSPDCQVAMDKQQTQFLLIPMWKWKMLTNYWKFPNPNVQTFGFVYHDTNGPKSWSSIEDPVVPLERNLYGHPLAGLLWERQFEKILLEHDWEKIPKLGMSLCTSWKWIILICVCGWHQIGWKETKHWSDVKRTQQRSRFGRSNIFPWSCILGLHSTTMPNKQRYCGTITEPCLNHEFPRVEQRNYHFLKIFVFLLHGLMIWLVMQRSVWKDIVSWQTRPRNNSTKFLLHASMTITSKK